MMSSKLSHNLLPYNQSPYLGIKLFKKVWHTFFKYLWNEIYGDMHYAIRPYVIRDGIRTDIRFVWTT